MNRLLRVFAVLAAAAGLALPGVAHARSHVFLGFNFGVPAYYPPPVYYAPPPPVYYAPPPPVVVYQPPPPVYTYAPPAPAPAPTVSPTCRTYNGDATIDASGRPFYGTACLGPDGRWHIQ